MTRICRVSNLVKVLNMKSRAMVIVSAKSLKYLDLGLASFTNENN